MAAILKVNSSYPAGVNPNGSAIMPYDSGLIVAQNAPGQPATRLVTGLQNQATVRQSDSTSGVNGNFIGTTAPYAGATVTANPSATITNITITNSGNTSTAAFLGTNTFVAGQTVKFGGLTTVPLLNGIAGVVLSSGLSSSGWSCTITQYTVASQTSTSETGTAKVNYTGRACLSIGPEQE